MYHHFPANYPASAKLLSDNLIKKWSGAFSTVSVKTITRINPLFYSFMSDDNLKYIIDNANEAGS